MKNGSIYKLLPLTSQGQDLCDVVLPFISSDEELDTRNHALTMIDLAQRSMRPFSKTIVVHENGQEQSFTVTRLGVGPLLTSQGHFWEYKFTIDDQWCEYTALVQAKLNANTLLPIFSNSHRVLVRLDSGCETGQLFGDITCDCAEQLKCAMTVIDEAGEGIIICIPRQDGRGKSTQFKLATLWLQNKLGLNTVQAASLLAEGKPIDVRTYAGAIAVLKFLGCSESMRFAVLTNNPHKLDVFAENGFDAEAVPHVVATTEHTCHHLEAKGRCLGHTNLMDRQKDSVTNRV